MSCTALGPSPPIQEILSCGLQLGIGNAALVAVVLFAIFMYGLYRMKVPFMVSIPISLVIVFVFAGAGNPSLRVGGVEVFGVLATLAVIFMAPIFILVFWKLKR